MRLTTPMRALETFFSARALTLDLDDTLWPVWPTIERAERTVHAWLVEHAPLAAAKYDALGLRRLRIELERTRPDLAHDLSGLRRESLRFALVDAGEDGSLAEPAFELFLEERNRVDLFEDVLPALEQLAARFPLVALTNGNADLARIGLDHLFVCKISARDVGAPKPDPRMFREACARLGLSPGDVLHVGDDVERDVRAALLAGLGAAWVVRPEIHPEPGPAPEGTAYVVRELMELVGRLTERDGL
jgi:FMN hydrolase / 5-amino-6-(5-phospho-D-ribitylamino)uracil phosphatase